MPANGSSNWKKHLFVGVIQGTFGVIQGKFGVIQGTFSVIEIMVAQTGRSTYLSND
jgi:hypothetical protein